MLHRQRPLYVLPIWLRNCFLLALFFMSVMQTLKLVAFYKVALFTSIVWYENNKAVVVKNQKESRLCAACAQKK
jgi:uncharacterized protein YqhQ